MSFDMAAMSVTVKDAAAFVNRDVRTIRRWAADGVDVSDPVKLREHADWMEMRSKGKTAQMLQDRPAIAQNAPSTFFDSRLALSVLAGLESLLAVFKKRMERAIAQSNDLEAGLLEEELRNLNESYRLLDITLEGHQA
jgi:hypothetical protein